jgi:hypothetical protein
VKPNLLGTLLLFVMSYYLVLLYIVLRNEYLSEILIFNKLSLSWGISIILTALVAFVMLYLFRIKKLPKKTLKISEKNNYSSETLGYLLTVFLSLLFVNDLNWNLIVLAILLYFVYVAGEIYYLQPLLMIFGYRTHKCKIDGENEIMVISKTHFTKNKIYCFGELFGNVYLLRGLNDGD